MELLALDAARGSQNVTHELHFPVLKFPVRNIFLVVDSNIS